MLVSFLSLIPHPRQQTVKPVVSPLTTINRPQEPARHGMPSPPPSFFAQKLGDIRDMGPTPPAAAPEVRPPATGFDTIGAPEGAFCVLPLGQWTAGDPSCPIPRALWYLGTVKCRSCSTAEQAVPFHAEGGVEENEGGVLRPPSMPSGFEIFYVCVCVIIWLEKENPMRITLYQQIAKLFF